ncbi:MAG: LysM peptidoglycan-binding domain-containing protein [Chloroflexota bacterium]
MERICPYLALADDGRTVADGFDAEHRCHALTPPAPLERARQVQLCLTEAHARCDRFASARTAWLAASSGLPRVAPDVDFGRTRLILEPEPAWRNLAKTPRAPLSRGALLVGMAAAAVVVVLLLGSVFRLFVGAPPRGGSPTPSPSTSPEASASTSPTASATQSASAVPTATIAPTPSPTPVPTQRIYIVKQGEYLSLIAQRFGTTVQAIKDANGLTSDTINVGQRLIIP